MPSDAKLGLAVGVSLVIVVAVVYFRTESNALPGDPAATIVDPDPASAAPADNRPKRPNKPTGRSEGHSTVQVMSRQQTMPEAGAASHESEANATPSP